ncbi:RNA-binding protein 12 [Hyperolius riggenbachi]|uniref:RNA-binding protein 12 n=1 Tax=Hyperolius riggenbachi TaxID=752182 RepID=UPI0035A3CC5F
MAVVIRLQGLPIVAGTMDIRHFFSGLTIPDGGVHIVGGEQGEAFIVFATDEDARLGMMRTGGTIKGSKVSLLLSSKTEMQNMIELSRRRFETANVDIPPSNTNRPGPPPNPAMSSSSVMSRVSLPTTVPNFSAPSTSTVSTVTTAHDGTKNVVTFSTANIGSAPPNMGAAFCNPSFAASMPAVAPQLPAVAPQLPVVPPPPIPPIPTIPTLPPMPSIPPMPVPPPVSTLPPVPPVPPIPPVPPVPPMTALPPISGLPPLNPPPVGPLPTGMNGSGAQMNTMNPLFLGPANPLPLGNQGPIKHHPPPLNHDDPYVSVHGLPIPVSETDVKDFFQGLRLDAVLILKDNMGRQTGSALVKLLTPHDTYEALKRHRMLMGQRFIEVAPASERQWVVSGGLLGKGLVHHGPSHIMQQPQPLPRSKSPGMPPRPRSRSPHEHGFCVYLKGLPYEAENKHVIDFFKNLDIIEESIHVVYGPNGKANGEGFLEFRNEADYKIALNKHKQFMGNRFIQVHPIAKNQMLEKLEYIRKKNQSYNYVEPQDFPFDMVLEKHMPRFWAHLSNLPYNIIRKDVYHFFNLEGVGVEEGSVQVLTDNNGQGIGQALVQFRSEDDARRAERLNRKKLNGRDAFVRIIDNEERKEIEANPPIPGRKGYKMQNYNHSPSESMRPIGDEFAFMGGNVKENNGQNFPFSGKFSGPNNNFAPPVPPPGLASNFVDSRPPPPGPSNVPNSPIEPPGFGGGPNNFNVPPSGFGNGPPPFGNGPSNANAPPNFNAAPPNLSGPGPLNAPPGFGPGNMQMGGPPGFSSGSGKPGPTVIRVQNMPFTVSVDEILDFFYGYQLIPGSVCLKYSDKGMPTGEALVAFESRDEAMAAVVDLNDRPIGSRKVKLALG